jgi:hypothetical protein
VAERNVTKSDPEQPESRHIQDALAQHIREHRNDRLWRQEDLAMKMMLLGFPWNRMTVAEIETRRRRVSLEEWLALAVIFEVAAIELIQSADGKEIVLSSIRGMAQDGTIIEYGKPAHQEAPLEPWFDTMAALTDQELRDLIFMGAPDEATRIQKERVLLNAALQDSRAAAEAAQERHHAAQQALERFNEQHGSTAKPTRQRPRGSK